MQTSSHLHTDSAVKTNKKKKKPTIKRADIFRLETGQDRKQKLHSKETQI